MGRSSGVTRRGALGATLAVAVGAEAAAAEPTAGEPAERVTGIGGFFFRAKDPKALVQWYEDHLGVTAIPHNYASKPWRQEAGTTAFAPFPEDTTYFGDRKYGWMLNFRVRDLDKMAAQLRAAGITVEIDPQTYPNGRFASLHDPEGNPLQLWQPGGVDRG